MPRLSRPTRPGAEQRAAAAAKERFVQLGRSCPNDGGPPGQTRIGNLGPQIRYHHRIKTHSGWQVCQPEPHTWLWRSPHHRIYLVNPTGTHPLGNTEFAQTIWHAAADPPAAFMSEPS
jgi:hypothetical protein